MCVCERERERGGGGGETGEGNEGCAYMYMYIHNVTDVFHSALYKFPQWHCWYSMCIGRTLFCMVCCVHRGKS